MAVGFEELHAGQVKHGGEDIAELPTNGEFHPTKTNALDENRLRLIVREELEDILQPFIAEMMGFVHQSLTPEDAHRQCILDALSSIMVRNRISLGDEVSLLSLRKVSIFTVYDEMRRVLSSKYGATDAKKEKRSIISTRYGKFSSKDTKAFLETCGIGFIEQRDGEKVIDFLVCNDQSELRRALGQRRCS